LLAVGQFTGQAVGAVDQVDHFQPVERVVQRIAFGLAVALGEDPGQQVAVDPHVLGHQQVLHHRHFLEQANVLEGARQPARLTRWVPPNIL
jgi:hypothetical protein